MTLDLNVGAASNRRWIWLAAAAVVAVAAGAWILRPGDGDRETTYRLGEVQRGTVTDAVSATGTISAVGVVELRPQVAGIVVEVLADFNSPVTAGQVLARLNAETFEQGVAEAEADLAIARASLVSSRASVTRAEADLRNGAASIANLEAQLDNARISLDAAQRDLDRQLELFARNVVSAVAVDDARDRHKQAQGQFAQTKAQLDAQNATLDSRRAALVQAEAGVVTAEAQVQQREAQLNAARIELSHAAITAPVDGIIINRSIEPGQTASTASNTDPLFIIAQGLQQMQVEVSVDEADIGDIRNRLRVSFGVDAYPGREYEGVVRQVRYAAETVQNVVTYTIIVAVRNADLSLLPGMTATARIILDERTDTLRIPNAALRYRPVGFAPAEGGGGGGGGIGGRPPGGGGPEGPPNAAANGGFGAGGGRPGAAGGAGAGAGGGGGAAFAVQLLQPYQALGLSDEQRARVTAALATVRQEVAAMRQQGATPEALQTRMAELAREAVVAVLTPEQAARLGEAARLAEAGDPAPGGVGAPGGAAASDRATPARRGRTATVFVLNDDGAPEPVQIQIGITDGGFTELVAGALTDGARVVTGSNEVEEIETPGGFRFFGF